MNDLTVKKGLKLARSYRKMLEEEGVVANNGARDLLSDRAEGVSEEAMLAHCAFVAERVVNLLTAGERVRPALRQLAMVHAYFELKGKGETKEFSLAA